MILDLEELNRRLSDKANVANRLRKDKSVLGPDDLVEKDSNSKESNPAQTIPVLPEGINKSEELALRRENLPTNQRGGRFTGQPNIPPIIRSLIGTCATLGSVKGTAEAFGVTANHTNNLKHAKTHQNGPTLPYLELSIKENAAEVRDAVVQTLKTSVVKVAEKLDDVTLTAKDHSVIAKNLSSIFSSLKDKDDNKGDDKNVHFHIHVPKVKTIDQYKTVEV